MNTIIEWLDEYADALICVIVWFVIVVVAVGAIRFERAHPCIRSHQEQVYHAPTYIQSGNMLIPVGGGTWAETVCDERKK